MAEKESKVACACAKAAKDVRSICYSTFRSTPEPEKLKKALRAKIFNLRRVNNVTDVPADVINNHELAEETMLMKKLTAGLLS